MAGLFSSVLPKIQLFIKDPVTVVPKSAFIFLSGKKDKKKRKGRVGKWEPAPPDASQLYSTNEHKCHCQAGIKKKYLTAANCAEVGGQQDMVCICREVVNPKERDRERYRYRYR